MSSLETIRLVTDGVNSYFYPLLTMSMDAPVGFLAVSEKAGGKGEFIAFGRWMRDRRTGARFISQPHAVRRAEELGLTLIDQGKLSHLERGMNGNPDPAFLRQLAKLYRTDYHVIVRNWMQARYAAAESDLSSHASTPSSALPTGGGGDDPTARELADLRQRVTEYHQLLTQTENAASILARAVAAFHGLDAHAGEQSNPPPRPQPGRRRSNRKAG